MSPEERQTYHLTKLKNALRLGDGVVTAAQLAEIGYPPQMLITLVDSGLLIHNGDMTFSAGLFLNNPENFHRGIITR
jgi:hypothetical protein